MKHSNLKQLKRVLLGILAAAVLCLTAANLNLTYDCIEWEDCY